MTGTTPPPLGSRPLSQVRTEVVVGRPAVTDDATTFIVRFPAPDPDALDTALRECPFDNEMMTACLFAAEEMVYLRAALAIAAGMISTLPQYENQHPQTVMEMLLEEARRG